MKYTLRQVFHSPKFVTGFVIFVAILLVLFIYPLFNPGDPLEMIGVGTFAKPGTYVSMYDAVKSPYETLRLSDAADKRIAASLKDEDRVAMVEYFGIIGVDVSELDITDTDALLDLWFEHFDETTKPKGMTKAKFNYYKRLNRRLADKRLSVELTEQAKAHILEAAYDPMYGARPLRRYLQHTVENLVSRRIIAGEVSPDTTLTVDERSGELEIL